MRRNTLHSLILAAAVSLLLAACSAGPAAPESNAADTEPGPGSLLIYSGRSDSLVQPIIDRFAEETGIDVDVRYGSHRRNGGRPAGGRRQKPRRSVLRTGPGRSWRCAERRACSLPCPTTSSPARHSAFASETGEWVGISGRGRVVVYNTDAIGDPATELPSDLWGFTEPEWNGRLGWAPSNGSFQAMVTAMRAAWGDEKTAEWLQAIQANNPQVYPNNTPIVAAVGAGEIDAGFVNHYYLYRFLSEEGETFPARNYFLPDGGPGSLIMVSGAGILDTAPNAENARSSSTSCSPNKRRNTLQPRPLSIRWRRAWKPWRNRRWPRSTPLPSAFPWQTSPTCRERRTC